MIDVVRRWAVDWLASHDPATCETLMADDYTLEIGAVTLQGREAYVTGTMGQLAIFPGLVLTVHDVIANEQNAAIRFTEHGAGTHKGGRTAAWGGIALFESSGGVLTRTWAEEDYLSRSRQLASGEPDVVEPPAVAPWDTPVLPPDPTAEATVRAWIDAEMPGDQVVVDDEWLNPDPARRAGRLDLDVLFSAGSRVAFHGRRTTDDGFRLGVSGLVDVDGGVVTGRLVTDRNGARSFARSAARA